MALWKIERTGRKFELTESSPMLDWLAVMAIAAAPGLLLLMSMPLPLVLPVFSIVSFLLACGLAVFAITPYASDRDYGPVLWDIIFAFTSIWVVAGVMSGPRQFMQWFEQLSTMP